MKIGVISDTHGYLDEKVFTYFKDCDEVWHVGDIGTNAVTDALKQKFTLRAVYGNIDGTILRSEFPEDLCFTLEGKKILITHIAGKPYAYVKRVSDLLKTEKPDVLVCGHSHILRVEFDKKYNVLYMNPGAAGVHGFHKVKTLLLFELESGELKNMKAIELGPRASRIE